MLALPLVAALLPAAGVVWGEGGLRLDPLLLVSLKEARQVAARITPPLYPGWTLEQTPVLFYRPGVQDVLVDFPHRPAGFRDLAGPHPLEGSRIQVRDDSTFLDLDDQNTQMEVDSIPVLVVADPLSRLRGQVRGIVLDRPREVGSRWLDDWGFARSPYGEVQLILHEAFHVYQRRRAPGKGANEAVAGRYPVLDPANNALVVLEGRILRDALRATDARTRTERAREFVAVRRARQSALEPEFRDYEDLNEYAEGTGRYVEYRYLRDGAVLTPIPEMRYHAGFEGYGEALTRRWNERLEDMTRIAAVSDDRLGNRFGFGPVRWRLYELGACQALLLDDLGADWKRTIFDPGVHLDDLLARAVAMSPAEERRALERAKSAYDYDGALRDKQAFERDGRQRMEQRVAEILSAGRTLVRIRHGAVAEKAAVGRFTPFGVTRVSPTRTLYELVPLLMGLGKGRRLDFSETIPVLVDEERREVVFAVDVAPEGLAPSAEGILETRAFKLTGGAMGITRQGREVIVELR
jgi:hypothetical protein